MAMIRNPGECSCIGMCTTIFGNGVGPKGTPPVIYEQSCSNSLLYALQILWS